jgi:hypothetical protein
VFMAFCFTFCVFMAFCFIFACLYLSYSSPAVALACVDLPKLLLLSHLVDQLLIDRLSFGHSASLRL